MSATDIEWADRVWNPVTGCTKFSPGCAHCYAETLAHRFWKDRAFSDVQVHPDRLSAPLRWRKPARIFVNSMSDLFHESVSDTFIDQVFAVMGLATWHTFIVLTKRVTRMRAYLSEPRAARWTDEIVRLKVRRPRSFGGWTPEWWGNFSTHIQIGASVENQAVADARLPDLIQTPAVRRIVSYEPALSAIDFSRWLLRPDPHGAPADLVPTGQIHQIIVGGESGPQARPCDVQWIRSAALQCHMTGVACFVKQLGARPYDSLLAWKALGRQESSLAHMQHVGAYRKNGKWNDPSEWPEDLRVRELV